MRPGDCLPDHHGTLAIQQDSKNGGEVTWHLNAGQTAQSPLGKNTLEEEQPKIAATTAYQVIDRCLASLRAAVALRDWDCKSRTGHLPYNLLRDSLKTILCLTETFQVHTLFIATMFPPKEQLLGGRLSKTPSFPTSSLVGRARGGRFALSSHCFKRLACLDSPLGFGRWSARRCRM